MDLDMPVLNGYAAAAAIRDNAGLEDRTRPHVRHARFEALSRLCFDLQRAPTNTMTLHVPSGLDPRCAADIRGRAH